MGLLLAGARGVLEDAGSCVGKLAGGSRWIQAWGSPETSQNLWCFNVVRPAVHQPFPVFAGDQIWGGLLIWICLLAFGVFGLLPLMDGALMLNLHLCLRHGIQVDPTHLLPR